MSFTTITDTEKSSYGVTLLPNVPTISATALKAKFEEKSDDLIIPKFNNLISELEDSTAAATLGASLDGTDTTVQVILDSLVSHDEDTDEAISDLETNKQDAEDGKGLSTNDFTDDYKTKLDGIEDEANNYELPVADSSTLGGVKASSTFEIDSDGVPTSTPAWTNVTSKPFSSVGTGLTVEDDTLKVSGSGQSVEWSDVNNKPFSTVGSTLEVDTNNELNVDQDNLDYDTEPTDSSTKLVTSGAIKTALDAKQDTLTFDTTPTDSSTNPVTSGGVKTALDEKLNSDIVTDEWDSSVTYAVDDYCIYDNTLWKCLTENTATTPTEGSDWTATTIGSELGSLNSDLADVTELISSTSVAVTGGSAFFYKYGNGLKNFTLNINTAFPATAQTISIPTGYEGTKSAYVVGICSDLTTPRLCLENLTSITIYASTVTGLYVTIWYI